MGRVVPALLTLSLERLPSLPRPLSRRTASYVYPHLPCSLGGSSVPRGHTLCRWRSTQGPLRINRRLCICSQCFSDRSAWSKVGPLLAPMEAAYKLVVALLSLVLNLGDSLFNTDLCSHSGLSLSRAMFYRNVNERSMALSPKEPQSLQSSVSRHPLL